MPEFPDVTIYIEALNERVLNQPIQKIRIGSPFILRSFEPPIDAALGKKVLGFAASVSVLSSCWKTGFFSSFIS
jgi:formamidopyrimidine-DNA glycosylase